MISLLLEDNEDDHYWRLECDSCKYTITYGYSREITEWKFKKNFISFTEKHYCPSCK